MTKILPILFAFISISAFADLDDTDKQIKQLAQHSQWHKLLRYEASDNRVKSAVKSSSFFLSEKGRVSPLKELIVNLKQVQSANVEDVLDYKCRFPERYRWLSRQIGNDTDTASFAECEEFWQWAKLDKLEGASLIYASGYLGNPASFFGHLLLKFNYSEDKFANSLLLDNSINFGAAIPPEDGAIVYVLKGFFGGYFAAFKDDSFYRHHRAYAEQESRTLWQYELNLTKQEVISLVSHVWELREQEFDYYYLNDNCASRMAELLAVIKPELATSIETPWVQPISIFKGIANNSEENFSSVIPIASHRHNFIAGYKSLSDREVTALLAEESDTQFTSPEYLGLSAESKRNVLDVLLDYSNYRQEFDHTGSQKQRQRILIERFKFPVSKASKAGSTEIKPHLGQLPSTWRYSVYQTESNGAGGKLQLRPTYYDLLSSDIGRLPYSSLGMGTTEVQFDSEGVYLSKFYLADILSLAPPETALENDQSLAWKIKVGLENESLNCPECLMGMTELGLGRSAFLGGSLLYGLGEIRLQTREGFADHFSSKIRIGALVDISDNWRSQLEFELPVSGYEDKDLWSVTWNNRFGAGIKSDWRLSIELLEDDARVEASYSYYWQ